MSWRAYPDAIDADLQDPPELLGEMMAKIDAGADLVCVNAPSASRINVQTQYGGSFLSSA